jgi:ABC-type glutathione transport system ATPase component
MTDIKTLKNMAAGLRERQKQLRADEAVFLKASGLSEEIEKAVQERQDLESELAEAKKRRDVAKMRKASAVSKVVDVIAEKMNQCLPFGSAVFDYDEDEDGRRKTEIAWDEGERVTPYNGLSGGQKQIFDSALANVLDANIIVIEAAELDPVNLEKTLAELAKLDKQVIVNTWAIPENVPEPFEIVGV